jgi:hypothetical protein
MNNNYLENIKTEDELFDLWRKKPYFVGENNVIIDHGKNNFVSDGIVNHNEWNKVEDKKKILFILKEAHSLPDGSSISELIKTKEPSRIWKRVIEWTYGITNTSKVEIAKYSSDKLDYNANNKWLNKIAILNIKKSNGKTRSSNDELEEYARYDKNEIKKQIEIINPDIIVCGYTGEYLKLICDGKVMEVQNKDNWYYFADLCGKTIIILDYYHPASQVKIQLNYYTITNIYQQALKEFPGLKND